MVRCYEFITSFLGMGCGQWMMGFKLQFVFHDEHVRLMFFFVQVMFYIAMSEAFMGWGFNSPI